MKSEETLVRMANQIAEFFRLKPEETAVAGTANHINTFWDPRMRKALLAYVAAGGEGLNVIALKAAKSVRPPAETPFTL